MFKNLPLITLSVGALFFSSCAPQESVEQKVASAHARNDGPALWKVTDHNSVLYLFGSVHLLPDGSDWQRRDLQAAFDEVGTVFFEIPDTNKANLEASVLQRQYGVYESGDRLSNHLDSAMQNHLSAAAYNVNLTPDKLEIFKPWIVADMLAIAAAEDAGLYAKNSVDAHLRAQAIQAGKAIKTLDDMHSYIEAVALQPDWVQIQSLEDTVRKFSTLADDFKSVNRAWIVGNTELLTRDMLDVAREKSPEMYAALFTNRTAKWSKTLDAYLQGDDTALVVVGIGHLLGEDGLPVRLTELGYDVQRVRRFDLPNQ